MNRSGYCENDGDNQWQNIMWRGAVKKAIDGKRGQAFLQEMLAALDAMPEKKLVKGELVTPAGEVCAIGSVMIKRGVDASKLDAYNYEQIASTMGISEALVREIEYENDEAGFYGNANEEKRFEQVRSWVASQIK